MATRDVYAEIGRKWVTMLDSDNSRFKLPVGVSFSRRKGSRACYFTCDNKASFNELVDFLDQNCFCWQEN